MKRNLRVFAATSLLCVLAVPAAISSAWAADKAEIDCKMDYSITGWSIIYKHSTGSGTVHCNNGQSMNVAIEANGVGITAGKWKITDGDGRFSDVSDISQILGDYAAAEATAGVVKSASTQVLTKGTVSLALAGHGEGVNLGVDLGGLSIKKAK